MTLRIFRDKKENNPHFYELKVNSLNNQQQPYNTKRII
jgi:hypothetical protein